MHSETGGLRSLSGGMSVILSSPDGRIIGGRVAGLLVAASPVQVLILLYSVCYLCNRNHFVLDNKYM